MKQRHLKDPGSAITHFIAMLMAIFFCNTIVDKSSSTKEIPSM